MTGRSGIACALVALLALGLWFLCGRIIAQEAVYPVENGKTWFAHGPWARVKGFFRPLKTAAENESLKREVASLRMLQGEVGRLVEENARLRGQLGLGTHDALPTNSWICAPVFSHGGAGGVNGLIRIGRGSLSGVKLNAAVAVPEGLVGRVEQVSPRTADVRLITDPRVHVACAIEAADPTLPPVLGILSGGGIHTRAVGTTVLYFAQPFHAHHLARRPRLSEGAKIVTSGLGGIFPRGLVIGTLMDGQDEDDQHLEREGRVLPAVDFAALEYVFIRREK